MVNINAEIIREGILRHLTKVGLIGLIVEEYPGPIEEVRKCFIDLCWMGLIRQTSKTRKNKNGTERFVWVLGEDSNSKSFQARAAAKINTNIDDNHDCRSGLKLKKENRK